jgi:hypothetical protein
MRQSTFGESMPGIAMRRKMAYVYDPESDDYDRPLFTADIKDRYLTQVATY